MTPEIVITAIVAFIAGGIFESILTSKMVHDLETEKEELRKTNVHLTSGYMKRYQEIPVPTVEDIRKAWFGEDKKTTKKVTVKKPTQKPVKKVAKKK